MRKVLLISLFVFLFLTIFSSSVFASSYVLPYPSNMPGSTFYKPRRVLERILEVWYFGSFGQFVYNLKLADKYLVEAKTLFEYNQYLLGFEALKKSDLYFSKTLIYLEKAKKEGKDISLNRDILSSAAKKHIEVLKAMNVPDTFFWQPEKLPSSVLNLKSAIDSSEAIRKKYL